jgi:hypothetical protein
VNVGGWPHRNLVVATDETMFSLGALLGSHTCVIASQPASAKSVAASAWELGPGHRLRWLTVVLAIPDIVGAYTYNWYPRHEPICDVADAACLAQEGANTRMIAASDD